MLEEKRNKLKIFNDPVYGFISIPDELIFDLIEHPYFQRLRRIAQMGLSHLVYPGATHSRFHHALGCLHLMQKAIETLRSKKIEITKEEELASCCAILLHDIGHGPFSHTLEKTIVEGVNHEDISLQIMEELNKEFNGELTLAIKIFKGAYSKKFLTQLIASQLDVDRLDYLKRDSFYTGVSEGNINSDRLISMLNVHENELVVDAKGIYSVEKFLLSRMFMYWQVYLHKTSVASEIYLTQALKRAKQILKNKEIKGCSPALNYFLNRGEKKNFTSKDLQHFIQLDDSDLYSALKNWQYSEDKVLSILSKTIILRQLPSAKILSTPLKKKELNSLMKQAEKSLVVKDGSYFVHLKKIEVKPYNSNNPIKIRYKNGEISGILDAEHRIMSNILTKSVEKYHLCYLDVKKIKY